MAKSTRVMDTEFGTGQKTLGLYLTGFLLCLVLTIIPFLLVAHETLSKTCLYITVTAFALVQLYVQVVCFLRLNASPKGRWNLMSFFFTIVIVLVLVAGSLWIMYNLNYNMMH